MIKLTFEKYEDYNNKANELADDPDVVELNTHYDGVKGEYWIEYRLATANKEKEDGKS